MELITLPASVVNPVLGLCQSLRKFHNVDSPYNQHENAMRPQPAKRVGKLSQILGSMNDARLI
jgi:hypothetical protein